ncbi:MAG: hypothetical protein K6F50_00350 [Kiritimatiellae bacterium]|nr:hypothetical protein [Kiritimatiellia bacterium]
MKRDFIQLAIAFFTLAVGGAAEELLPRLLSVGIPVLLSASAYFAVRRAPVAGMLFALAAGAAEDALCALPYAVSIAFFAAVAALMRGFKLPLACAAPAYVVYQLWLWIWLGQDLPGNIFARMFAALPVGAATLLAVHLVLSWVDGKAAVDEK